MTTAMKCNSGFTFTGKASLQGSIGKATHRWLQDIHYMQVQHCKWSIKTRKQYYVGLVVGLSELADLF